MSATDADSTFRIPFILRRFARRLLRRAPTDAAAIEVAIIKQSDMFDADWYLKRYPDVASVGMDPVEHYVRHGASEGRNPGSDFDTKFYTEHNPDVIATGMNPFRHYVEYGHKERRAAIPQKTGGVRKDKIGSKTAFDIATIAASGVLDHDYYLDTYPAVARAGMDPIVHYAKYGAKEGRNPCALFDTRYYLRKNPDVAASGMNPLVHFSKFGSAELRNPSVEFHSAWYWLKYLAESDGDANPLAHYMAFGQKAGLDICATDGLSAEDKQSLAETAERLLHCAGQSAGQITRIGNALTQLSRWGEAEKAFREAVARDWHAPELHERLARNLARQGKWWQVIESLQRAIELSTNHADWFYRLGDAQERMNRFEQATVSYRRAIALADGAGTANWHYRLGYAYEKSGELEKAEQAYAQALERDERAEVKSFGIGMLHQLRGYWPEAVEAYTRELKNKPFNATLHYKLGMAQDRCYRWAEAESAYHEAITLNAKVAHWHYRYGFVLERQGRWCEAAKAYAEAAVLNSRRESYWYYRCAYVLERAGEYEQACLAYIQTQESQTLMGGLYHPESRNAVVGATEQEQAFMDAINGNAKADFDRELEDDQVWQRYNAYLEQLPGEEDMVRDAIAHDATGPHLHYRLGEVREKNGDWRGAAGAYADAVARSNPYRPAWYYRLGFALYRDGQFKEACRAFRETRILRRPFGVDAARYQRNPEQKTLMEYNEYLETLPLREKCVLYESMHGTSVGGNPYAVFAHIFNGSVDDKWTHVWVLARGMRSPKNLRRHRNIVFVERQSDLYRRYLATASHLINDVTFPYWFIRRPEQKYLNTWHGTPLKKLGKYIPGEFMAHGNIQRNLLQTTHLISPNKHTSDALIESYDVDGILAAKLAETGYPRIDRTLNATREQCESIRGQLGLTNDRPIVLYAPTWRGTHGRAEFDVDRLQADIAALVCLPCQVVFRGHHMVAKMLGDLNLPVVVAGQEVDASDVLAITDILITDYSSIFFDFLPLKRPIFHYCYDWDDYTQKRGMYLDIHALPGRVCEDLEALVAGLSEQLGQEADTLVDHAVALARFCPHEDGEASARVVDFFLRNDDRHVVDRYGDTRRSLLFYAGPFAPNGITASFLNLINGLVDLGQDRLSVIFDAEKINAESVWKQKFDELPVEVGCLPRIGRMVQSPEEYWIAEKFSARRSLPTAGMWDVICGAYKKELTRLIGCSRIDTFVNFEGYNAFWTATFGMGGASMTNVSYLHNDMVEEYRLKHPYLASLFGMHRYYDRLVSVSEHMSQVNKEKMGVGFDLPARLFKSCINTINAAQIRQRAAEPLDDDLVPWLEAPHCFLTMGRMSPEKDHAKLVEAFAQVHDEYPDTRLVIFGDGPLKHVLESMVARHGLGDAIYLAGLRENPFPALSRCSCFVLPSNHEGQPMVLLEAMTLHRPILATDIDGHRGALGDQYGKLVSNSVKGLSAGMREFLSNGVWPRNFDADAYHEEAIGAFRRAVSGSPQAPSALSKTCVIDSNKVIVAARADGLGERMNALLNAMFLADKLSFKFAFYWSTSGTWESAGADRSHHAIVSEQEFFSRRFIESYSLESFNRKGFKEISGSNVTSSDLLTPTAKPAFKGWLAPRIDLKEVLSKELLPDNTLSFRDIFRRIGFSDSIEEAVSLADVAPVPPGCVALHLRSGDIFYGPYRKWVHYSYKGITLPIAKAIINKLKSEGADVLLFGQDNEVLKYLRNATGALLLEDLGDHSFQSPAARAMYELVLMSRCEYIVAGSSGFARQASLLGGVSIKQPKDFFDHKEQTRIAIKDLARYGEKYHPLQTAFAYWYAYFYGRQFKSVEMASELLSKAGHFDPDNQLYPIKLAACYLKAHRLSEGDEILRHLVTGEFNKAKTSKLPCFDVLVAKTLGKYNLAEDFDSFSDGAASGEPFCAAFHYVICRAANKDVGRALKLCNENRGDDMILASLCQSWASEQCSA